MSQVVAPTRPDTSDMIAVHQVFRRALAAAPRIIGGASRHEPAHVANVDSYYANVLAFLHVHHEGEDALLWPKLLSRCPAAAPRVQAIADQHETVTTLVAQAETRLEAWAVEPSADNGAQLIGALALLDNELTQHLDQEEEFVLPLAAEYLTVEEWAELPAHGMRNFSGDKVWVLLGLLFEAMPPGQPEVTLTHMPAEVAQWWRADGEPAFDALIADVRR
jgi:hemerythrin-like domain-containing protein